MGYRKEDIIPVKLSMKGAISEDLAVEGGVVAEVSVSDEAGYTRSTKQLIYVSAKMEKAFLCREAMEQLGIIRKTFPQIPQSTYTMASADTEGICNCPRRGEVPPIPTRLPPGLDATEKNLPDLKQWLIEYYKSTTFNTCEHQPLPMMSGEPLKLHVDPKAKPVAAHRPAMVPIHWQDQVYRDLERDVNLGVLERVGPNTPVTWCSRMVVTSKSDGTPRRTVDLQPQNRHAVRQTHHVPTPFHLADRVPQQTKKTVTDAWNGYHSVPICEEDRHVTTFITPWGRYRYKVAPQGFLSSGDGYNLRFDAIIADFPNKVKCVDDTCMWATSIEDAFFQTCQWLDLCGRNGITLNPKKFQFAQDSVDFAGLTITPTNVRPNSKFLDTIMKFPTPKNITGARAWFGLVNQGAYSFSVAKEMRPFRHLLKPATKFDWTPELQEAFERSKVVMVEAMKEGVRLYDPSRVTNLATDWSVEGIGFMLRQKYCACKVISPACCNSGWKLCLVGSRFTTETESRYSPIEGEALAVAYALKQTRYYTLGCENLVVSTDHKPLLQILNDRSLADITNRRLLNLKEKTMEYRFTIIHVTGAKNKGPDAASRYPSLPRNNRNLADEASFETEASATLYLVSNMISWEMVRKATMEDETLSDLKILMQEGMPPIQDLKRNVRAFHQYADHLYSIDDVVMLGQRIIIPKSLQQEVLRSLHAAHQGINAMCQRAADSVFWPGITTDITRIRNECKDCHRIAKSNAMEPPCFTEPPEYPFQQICCDYFQHGSQNYLVIVERYSNWPIVFQQSGKAEALLKRLREVFITFGVPEELASDGGPQFTAAVTQEFLKSWCVHHRLASVANPHSNNRAEVAVKTVKRMLMSNTSPTGSLNVDAFQRAMLIYRNSIDPESKSSPAMVVFGHPIRDPIPIPLGRYCPHPTWQETMANRERALAKRHSREREKWTAQTKELPPLEIGNHVYVQNMTGNNPLRWERTGVIIEVRPFKQYAVRLDGSGRVTLRNRKNLRKFKPFSIPAIPSSEMPLESDMPIPRPSTHPEQNRIKPTETPGDEVAIHGPHKKSSTPALATPENKPEEEPAAMPQEFDIQTEPVEHGKEQRGESQISKPPGKKKVPLALRRLFPHNPPGLSEN